MNSHNFLTVFAQECWISEDKPMEYIVIQIFKLFVFHKLTKFMV